MIDQIEAAAVRHRLKAMWLRDRAHLFDELGRHELAEQTREEARRFDRLGVLVERELEPPVRT